MLRTASRLARRRSPWQPTRFLSSESLSFPRTKLSYLSSKLKRPEAAFEPFIATLEDNWYTSEADVLALTSADAATLHIPLRILQLLQEGAPVAAPVVHDTFEPEPAAAPEPTPAAATLPVVDSSAVMTPPTRAKYESIRIGKKKQDTYGLTAAETPEALQLELNRFLAYMTTPSLGQMEPPIRMSTAEPYIRLIRLALGYARDHTELQGPLTLQTLIPSAEASSAEVIFQYIQWLRLERKAAPNYCANMLRALLKLAKYLYGRGSKLDPTYGDKAFDDIPVIRELRKMHKTTSLQSGQSHRAVDEEKKWLAWPDFLGVVEALKLECKETTENDKPRTKYAIAQSYQKCVMLGIFSGIPDRQRTLREIEIGRTLHQNASGQWIITHGPDDYKTGKAYGERPPLVIPDHIVPYLNEFLTTWRKELNPVDGHNFLFCNTKGEQATADFIYRTFTRTIYRHTGKKTNPHLLRDSIVTYLRGQSSATEKDLEALAIYMGHSLHMQKSSYDRRTKSQKVAPAIELIQSIKPAILKK
ncbi:hypothetical protein SPRG_12628 [Saprolegnia parasitica CBS 223.65]|uniref:Tyr recombinase domain-containing protein n=1 Tax=Saprolegnia parasitica (strain CBS 223.65) TaxID=695850 RepID=A0A067C5J3_SAPPC|nr:hypothetical protein SPRG_12628 [Saprolegnia parasitica CBS 223.65]KDO21811.1 hypothetical protein SPRG_12628 [Saprolegnia parasitica CBS 223.65]|eukprot:XP_012207488.1 hypothetical protein SPRG_12628 [Saprolegnia parasitica CBS 223.65]